MPPLKKCQAEYLADTKQIGGDFRWQLATFDNPDDTKILFLFLNLDMVLSDSTQKISPI